MDLSSLSAYLSSAKKNLDKSSQSEDVHVVMGNEGCDLDSVISSIIIGYYTAHSLSTKQKASTTVFPVINCSRQDLPLRTESVFYLKQNGIDMDQLICRDEIDLLGLCDLGKLKLTLVDHNVLASWQVRLDSSVTWVIDHHKRERKFKPGDVIETVGSCTTLVGGLVLSMFTHDPIVCRLLYGTILLDTYNFSEVTRLGTPKDVKIFHKLEQALLAAGEEPNRNEIFEALLSARSDCSHLTPDQILNKDTKIIRPSGMTISIPSVPMASTQFLEISHILEALNTHWQKNDVAAILVLCNENDVVQKGCIVYSEDTDRASKICKVLENSELKLSSRKTTHLNSAGRLFVYDQGNVLCNRKFYVPLLLKHFGVSST